MLIVNLCDSLDHKVEFHIHNDDYYVFLKADKNISLKNAASNKVEFENAYQRVLDGNERDKEKYVYFKNLIADFDNFLSKVDMVTLEFDHTNTKKYMLQDEELKKHKRCVYMEHDFIDENKVLKFISNYSDMLKDTYVTFDYYDYPVTMYDVYNFYDNINSNVKNVRQLGLSPLESVLYLYETLRKNMEFCLPSSYNELTKIQRIRKNIKNEKSIHYFILHLVKLGIATTVDFYKADNGYNHRRLVLKIDDPKYNVNGLYYFDPVLDSPQEKDDRDYLNRLSHFAKLKNEIEVNDEIIGLKCKDNSCLGAGKELFKEIEESFKRNEWKKYLDIIVSFKMYLYGFYNNYNKLNNIEREYMNLCRGKIDARSQSNMLEIARKGIALIDNKINPEVLIDVIHNVRCKLYEIDPNLFDYQLSDLKESFTSLGIDYDFDKYVLEKEYESEIEKLHASNKQKRI